MLSYYMRLAVRMKQNKSDCSLKLLELLRLKVKLQNEVNPIPVAPVDPYIFKDHTEIGCNRKLAFYLKSNRINKLGEGYLCRVYRRVRWLDSTQKKKYKDWKIKVIQENEPKSMDYLVIHKLPCKLSQLEAYLQADTLKVELEHKCTPKSIKYIELYIQYAHQR